MPLLRAISHSREDRAPTLPARLAYDGRALIDVLRAAWMEYELDRARYLAVAMVYYALVSLVPLLSLLLGALGLLLRYSEVAAETRRQTLLLIEERLGPELSATVTGLLDTLQQQSVVATIVSLVGLLLAASVLFKHLRLSFRAIWNYDPPLVGPVRAVVRATILERVVSFAMVLGGGGLLLVSLGLIAATQWVDRLLGRLPVLGSTTASVLTATISLLLTVMTFACLFKVLPPVSIRWRDIWLGALLCGVSWVIASELLALYAVVFGGRSSFGAVAGLLVVMLWMNIVSQVLFFGAELCKVVAMRRSRAKGPRTRSPVFAET
jgi:membrane protein